MSESIHVPSHQVKRLRAFAKLFLPVITIAAVTAWTTTVTWFRTRTSAEEIRPEIKKQVDEIRPLLATCTADSAKALAQLQTDHVQIYALQQTALTMATTVIELHAQAEVIRAYGHSKQLPFYIERARRFYAREFETQQQQNPNNLVGALNMTRLKVWRPDRD